MTIFNFRLATADCSQSEAQGADRQSKIADRQFLRVACPGAFILFVRLVLRPEADVVRVGRADGFHHRNNCHFI